MKCVICKSGETLPGLTTVTLQRNNRVVIIKQVPADVCEQCGEYYLSEEITKLTRLLAEKAELNNTEVEILSFVA